MDFLDVLLIVMAFTAVIFWLFSLVYMFYDDIVKLLTNDKKTNIIEDTPVYSTQNFKLRRPVK